MNHLSNNGFITQHRHKSHRATSKVWININQGGTQSINDSYNVSSVTDDAVGKTTVTFDQDFANTNYSILVGEADDDNGRVCHGDGTNAVGSHPVGFSADDASFTDANNICVAYFGDQECHLKIYE